MKNTAIDISLTVGCSLSPHCARAEHLLLLLPRGGGAFIVKQWQEVSRISPQSTKQQLKWNDFKYEYRQLLSLSPVNSMK